MSIKLKSVPKLPKHLYCFMFLSLGPCFLALTNNILSTLDIVSSYIIKKLLALPNSVVCTRIVTDRKCSSTPHTDLLPFAQCTMGLNHHSPPFLLKNIM